MGRAIKRTIRDDMHDFLSDLSDLMELNEVRCTVVNSGDEHSPAESILFHKGEYDTDSEVSLPLKFSHKEILEKLE